MPIHEGMFRPLIASLQGELYRYASSLFGWSLLAIPAEDRALSEEYHGKFVRCVSIWVDSFHAIRVGMGAVYKFAASGILQADEQPLSWPFKTLPQARGRITTQ